MVVTGLRFGALRGVVSHVCVDMQRVFAEPTAWHVPGLPGILPAILCLSEALPDTTFFTRFLTPPSPAGQPGRWRDYYEGWPSMTLDRLDPALLDLVEPLARLARPDRVFTKRGFSAFAEPDLDRALAGLGARTLLFTGVETDVCVLASVLAAADRGYRCVVVTDAVAGADEAGHHAALATTFPRFRFHIETATSDQVLAALDATQG
ncbi:MAG: cysteine hydrolase [Alphaproteobacteria bacterium]|nr:cysteine hydrolase [Alphaproteobacteria bacterium]